MTSHEQLTDKMSLHYYELNKLEPLTGTESGKDLWLKLFRADTEEELTKIEKMGAPEMSEAITAYRHVAASAEFKKIESMRSKARHDEAQALRNERRKAEKDKAFEIARNALEMNLSMEDIIKLTGLTHEEIESIKVTS